MKNIIVKSVKAAFIMSAVILSGCGDKAPSEGSAPAIHVKIDTVKKQAAATRLDYLGVVEEKSSTAVGFPALGTIERIYVSEGDYVHKGQLLARLDQSSAQNMLEAAGATLKQARDAYERLKSIHDKGSLPEIQMVDVATKLRQAESSYSLAEKNLQNCALYAPAAGIIGKKMAEAGEYSIAGKPILTILDIGSVQVKFSVPENEISTLSADCRSEITVTALGDKKFTGYKIRKSVLANSISHTYPAYITLLNPGNELLPGMVCRVGIYPGIKSQNIVVPIGIVQTSAEGEKFVWCDKGGVAKRTFVTTGEAKDNGVEIIAGLEDGDLVVTMGYQKISEDDKITWK